MHLLKQVLKNNVNWCQNWRTLQWADSSECRTRTLTRRHVTAANSALRRLDSGHSTPQPFPGLNCVNTLSLGPLNGAKKKWRFTIYTGHLDTICIFNFFWLVSSRKTKTANIKMTLLMITVDCRCWCTAIYDEELFKVGPLYFGCTFPGNLSFAWEKWERRGVETETVGTAKNTAHQSTLKNVRLGAILVFVSRS